VGEQSYAITLMPRIYFQIKVNPRTSCGEFHGTKFSLTGTGAALTSE